MKCGICGKEFKAEEAKAIVRFVYWKDAKGGTSFEDMTVSDEESGLNTEQEVLAKLDDELGNSPENVYVMHPSCYYREVVACGIKEKAVPISR